MKVEALWAVRKSAEVAKQGWLMESTSGQKAESNSRTECARIGAATLITVAKPGCLRVPDEVRERIAKAVQVQARAAIRPLAPERMSL